jgi:hypothetical protein
MGVTEDAERAKTTTLGRRRWRKRKRGGRRRRRKRSGERGERGSGIHIGGVKRRECGGG